MRTNREKYEHYCAEIAAKDSVAIAALLPDGVPSQFYTIQGFEAAPSEVSHIGVSRRGIYKHDESDRVSKAEVELAMKYAEEWVAPTLDSIYVHYKKKEAYGSVSGAHPYNKIGADANMAWLADDLAGEIERRRELYAPREGHTACDYCRKQHPTESLVSRKIFYRDQGGSRTKIGKYCCDQCGYNDQCGHEG